MGSPGTIRLTYDQWRPLLDQELGCLVVDDEGRRRCLREAGLSTPLTREQAENYYRYNAFVRQRRVELSSES
ncbi:MAG: hypothetical protein ACT4PU_10410 [Planctomycetota bacterium]